MKTKATELGQHPKQIFLSVKDLNTGQINKSFNGIIKEAELETGGKNKKESSSKFSRKKTKQHMQNGRVMKISPSRNKIDLAELKTK